MNLTPPMEDYLEAIGQTCGAGGVARVKDIAARMKVTNPSVVRALRALKQKKLIQQEHYGYVRLTEAGEKIAQAIIRRHETLTDFLENILGLDEKTAARDACEIEHAVSPETMRRLSAAAVFLKGEAHADLDWRGEFAKFYRRQSRRWAS
jgi:DtxR family Mn-dependent transcriptional regulator